jgi:Reverse transcriptase (RNA-dependent DNA polymerase)
MESMRSNNVWELVDLPEGHKAIGNKWVLKIKRLADGSIDRYKARLVAKGYTQQEGIDYEETFSPVVRFASIRLILAIIARLDLELHQMDVKTAFLNGNIEEEIYMEQPASFVVEDQEHKVCKLLRSIYGLKQSFRQWYIWFHQAIISFDFKMIDEYHCVYVKRSKNKFVILSLYVDDILLASNNKEYVQTIKEWLSSNFDMKDMSEASYILGVKIEIDRSKKILALSQEHYIRKVLEKFRMQDCKSIDTPIVKGEGLSLRMCPKTPDEKTQMEKVPYSSVVGSLIYAMMCTKPYISFAVGMVSRYQANPGLSHWKAVKRILRYLKGTADYSLCFQGENLQLMGYVDADWEGDLDERKSISGYIFLLNNGVIS